MSADPRVALCLALADDELVIGQRHTSWTGVAPHLEEDLALASIAQDELGHAVVFYEIAAALCDSHVDALALGRLPEEYRNAILCERENGDWGYTIARHWAYDTADAVRLESFASSSWDELAEAAAPIRREERHHLVHARAWITRLAEAGGESRERLVAGLTAACAEVPGVFEEIPEERRLLADGVLATPSADLLASWRDQARAELDELGLAAVVDGATGDDGMGGRHGRHTAGFAALWEELTMLHRADPDARW